MRVTNIVDQFGRPIENNLEDPTLDLNDPRTWDGIIRGVMTSSGVHVSPRTALAYPPLWRALNLISGDVGRLPLSTYRRMADGGKEPARKHPAYLLMRRRANAAMRASAFKRTLTYHALFRGNGCAAILRDGTGAARELLILDPDETCMAVVAGAVWYRTMIGGDQIRLPERDVFHIRGLSHNGLWGIDVFELMREALGLPIAAREFMSGFFGNGSNLSGVLMVPGSFSAEKATNVLKTWNEMATGIAKSHKVGTLTDNVKWVPTGVKPKEAETTTILEHEIRTVSAITGCPPHKLGDSSRTSFNSLEAENQSYLDDCLDAWLVEWEEEADAKLLTTDERDNETHFHEFNRNARLRTDSAARGTFYRTLRETGVLTGNDIARRENMPTFGPDGDKRYISSTLVEIGAPSRAKETAKANRRVLVDLLNARGKIEREKVQRAAAKPETFTTWLDTFYAEHLTHLHAALDGVRRIAEAQTGRRLRNKWRSACFQFAAAHRAELLAAGGRVTGAELVAEVERICGTWSHGRLVTQLLKGIT